MLLSIRDDIYTYSNCPEEEIDKLANIILKNIEDYGMKPPGRWSSVLRGNTAKREIARCSWEDEDE